MGGRLLRLKTGENSGYDLVIISGGGGTFGQGFGRPGDLETWRLGSDSFPAKTSHFPRSSPLAHFRLFPFGPRDSSLRFEMRQPNCFAEPSTLVLMFLNLGSCAPRRPAHTVFHRLRVHKLLTSMNYRQGYLDAMLKTATAESKLWNAGRDATPGRTAVKVERTTRFKALAKATHTRCQSMVVPQSHLVHLEGIAQTHRNTKPQEKHN